MVVRIESLRFCIPRSVSASRSPMKRTSRRSMVCRQRRVLMALGYHDYQLHRGIARFARQAGWILDTSMAHYGVVPEHWQGDGILTLLIPGRTDIMECVRRRRVPVVAMTTDVPEMDVPRVRLDNQRIGELGAEHLIERGFEDLAFYQFSDIDDVRGREAGFRRAVLAAGRRYHHLNWHAAAGSRNWLDWLTRRLRRLPLPIGIMAQSDNRAAFVLSACEAAGIAVPQQAAVVGVDNDLYACEFAAVPISSVDSNRETMAYEAAALLERLMRGERAPEDPRVVPPCGVVVRKSSDMLAIRHKAVARALNFIWEHFAEPIDVDDVIKASRMSRCGIYRAFEKHVGGSIGEELSRKRVDRAKQLLVDSSEKLHRVAGLCGFSGGEHFSRAFTRLAGMSPSSYRRKYTKPQTMDTDIH